MSVINTNVLSIRTQNNLIKSQGGLGTAIERLSSGLRINSAKDDAAGQAIANRFTANINGLTQAARNANDGISMAQTTEGALNEVNNNLQRIRELSVQAANGTNSSSDLRSTQAEINQRLAEISRVAEQTQFNGVSVLGADSTQYIQVGANDNQTISIDLKKMDATSLGMAQFSIAGPRGATTAALADDFANLKDSAGASVPIANVKVSLTLDSDAAKDVAATELVKDSKGNFFVKVAEADAGPGALGDKFYAVSLKDFKVQGVGAPATAIATVRATRGDLSYAATDGALAAIDRGLEQVSGLRSALGAVQNRFQSTIANLNKTVENLEESRSRIQDADYAKEVSAMTKNQILQQAGTSVLSQANQVPQTVLSLLR